jgi:hypothetical protein
MLAELTNNSLDNQVSSFVPKILESDKISSEGSVT